MTTETYHFPTYTPEMHAKLKHWFIEHNNGECAKRKEGAVGGAVSFIITPTSICDFVKAKCFFCKEEIELSDPP